MTQASSSSFSVIAERVRRAGQPDRAVQLCLEGLAQFPDHLSARVTLGWALLDLGRDREAFVELQAVLKRAPDNLAAIRGLAELHARGGADVDDVDLSEEWPPDAAVAADSRSEAETTHESVATYEAVVPHEAAASHEAAESHEVAARYEIAASGEMAASEEIAAPMVDDLTLALEAIDDAMSLDVDPIVPAALEVAPVVPAPSTFFDPVVLEDEPAPAAGTLRMPAEGHELPPPVPFDAADEGVVRLDAWLRRVRATRDKRLSELAVG